MNTDPQTAHGRVLSADDSFVLFSPANTPYRLKLKSSLKTAPQSPIDGVIRAKARKVLTVSGGGNFISPIEGPPRVIQGWVTAIEGATLVVKAGAPMVIELPPDEHAFSLSNGDITVGSRINLTLFPDATFEPLA